MNARTQVLSSKGKIFRQTLILAGIWIFHVSSTGLKTAGEPEDFARGMFVGGLAWVVWLTAAILAVLAFACWRAYLKVGLHGRWRFVDLMTLLLALVPNSIWIAIYLARLVCRG